MQNVVIARSQSCRPPVEKQQLPFNVKTWHLLGPLHAVGASAGHVGIKALWQQGLRRGERVHPAAAADGRGCIPGGDFGGMVAYVLGALHPEHCAAVHSNITVCLPSIANPWTMLQVRPALHVPCCMHPPTLCEACFRCGLECSPWSAFFAQASQP